MRSNDGPVSGKNLRIISCETPLRAGGQAHQGPEPFEAGEDALRIRQVEISQHHRDLDDTIALLSQAEAYDELLIARLKKRKLRIKDEIARIERLLPVAADHSAPGTIELDRVIP
jgi:hypothetical protein